MTKLRLIVASGLIMLGLAACDTGGTNPPSTTPQPEQSAQPTSGITPIPESEYPAPGSQSTEGYPSPSSSP